MSQVFPAEDDVNKLVDDNCKLKSLLRFLLFSFLFMLLSFRIDFKIFFADF